MSSIKIAFQANIISQMPLPLEFHSIFSETKS